MDKYLQTQQKTAEFTRYFNLEGEKREREKTDSFLLDAFMTINYLFPDYLQKATKLPILLSSIYTVNYTTDFCFWNIKIDRDPQALIVSLKYVSTYNHVYWKKEFAARCK